MNNNHHDPYDDLPTHLLASTAITTYRRRRHILRRLAILALILLAALALARFASAAPSVSRSYPTGVHPHPYRPSPSIILTPAPTTKPWPPSPPNTYYCRRGNPHPPAYCYRPNSRRPSRR